MLNSSKTVFDAQTKPGVRVCKHITIKHGTYFHSPKKNPNESYEATQRTTKFAKFDFQRYWI